MKYKFYKLVFLFCILSYGNFIKGQEFKAEFKTVPLSTYDSVKLSQLPQLVLSQEVSRRLLPPVVDNSTLPYLRPVFSQDGSSCGQAASIGYVFTYEINCIRNLPANVPTNQYPTHFAYNFINTGSEYVGVSYYETYEILKHAGSPTVEDYNGMSYGGYKRWISGYDHYYNAMHNRIKDVYSIKVNTEEGIQTLKNWIYDHGDGSPTGGVGCFYAQLISANRFPNGVPEAGKFVELAYGAAPDHALTIVGYNDSIRWDFNNDGLYTNDIDLNGDSIIDVRDWEIGGFKIVNSYGDDWGDHGFIYTMYKSVAEKSGQNGIWNNTVVVIDVKENHEPQLTAKVKLTHGCRRMLQVTAGISTNAEATEPEFILHYPVFDYQGGCQPMQGAGSSDTLEMGIDLNRLLNYIEPGQVTKFFLMIRENDPESTGNGTLESFSIIDYTNGGTEIYSNVAGVPIVNNSLTIASLITSVNFDPVLITINTLPETELYSDFTFQFQSTGGTQPHKWHLVEDYVKNDSSAVIEQIDGIKLTVSSNSCGKALIHLPFPFPFYGKLYSDLYAAVDGYLLFIDNEIPWTYLIESRTYFLETQMIAPLWCSSFVVSSADDGIWYEHTAEYAIFRWKVSCYDIASGYANVTVKIFPDGRIEYVYGQCNLPYWLKRYTGISNGDGLNYEIMSNDPDFMPVQDQMILYSPNSLHAGLSITKDGLLRGNNFYPVAGNSLTVCSADQNDICDYKTFNFNCTGLKIDYTILSGDDDIIEFGENGYMNLVVTNLNPLPLDNITLTLSCKDPNFTIIDSTSSILTIQPGESVTLTNEFNFITSNSVSDNHAVNFKVVATSTEDQWQRTFNLTGYRPVIAESVIVNEDLNLIPDPGDTIQLQVKIKNKGGADLANTIVSIHSINPFISLLTDSIYIDTLLKYSNQEMIFESVISPDLPSGQIIDYELQVSGNHDFLYTKPIHIITSVTTENFESEDLSILGWQTGSDHPWFIEEGDAYEGNSYIRSAIINDTEHSDLRIPWNIATDDSISFWIKVDSEPVGDFLVFNIDYREKGRWSGNTGWMRCAFPVEQGWRYFKWIYYKGWYSSVGGDCAKLDYIVFPPLNGNVSVPLLEPNNFNLALYPNPASELLNISFDLAEKNTTLIRIIDMTGKKVFENEKIILLPGKHKIATSIKDLKPGFYTVILSTPEGNISRIFSKF
ncbi:MAG TPA: T9SS type A sorting domain-containing protein [Lentimicrobium sp.]|nr:T9SS type A sorting domain-containing protein [Lentimicrobium sp.]